MRDLAAILLSPLGAAYRAGMAVRGALYGRGLLASADAGVPVKVASLPRGAVVLSGNLVVTTGFGASAKIKLGFAGADAAHGDIDVAATGSKPLTVSGIAGDKTDLIATPNAAMAAGAATLYVTYVIAGRANEAQP